MYINFVFFGYMAAVFLGLAGIVIMMLSVTAQNFEKTKPYYCVTFFAISSFCYSALYFVFYYRENVLNKFELGLIWRVADYLIGCGLIFLWILVLRVLDEHREDGRRFFFILILVLGARTLFSCTMAAFFMDGYYYIKRQNSAMPFIEMAFIAASAALMMYCYYQAMKTIPLFMTKLYITIVSAALILLDLSQSIVNYYLYSGEYGISAWNLETFDPTGPILTIVNLATLIFAFKTDFTPIYIAARTTAEPEKKEPMSLLDQAAEKHKLTRREREVIELVYDGFTNPDIAEQLCISRNTVKQHIHNIFEKLDVSTRIELIHLINSQKEITKNSD